MPWMPCLGLLLASPLSSCLSSCWTCIGSSGYGLPKLSEMMSLDDKGKRCLFTWTCCSPPFPGLQEPNVKLNGLAEPALVDELAHRLERGVAIGHVWLDELQHVQDGLVDLN